MKRIFLLLLAVLTALSACAQAPEESTGTTTVPTTAPVTLPETTAPTQSLTEPEPTDPPATEPPQTQPPQTTRPFTDITRDLQELYLQNSDLVGWICIPNTRVDYPVFQTPDRPNYYLNKDLYGNYSVRGSIYIREACDVFAPSDNLTFYGHAMGDQSMFGDLHYYKSKSFWQSHKTIQFDTLYEKHTYEIFAVFNIDVDPEVFEFRYHLFDDAADQAAFDEFVSQCVSRSSYDTGIVPQYGDKLITLSTCDRNVPLRDGRLVVVARRVS